MESEDTLVQTQICIFNLDALRDPHFFFFVVKISFRTLAFKNYKTL